MNYTFVWIFSFCLSQLVAASRSSTQYIYIYIYTIHSASLLDWIYALERTCAFLTKATFVVQHRAVLLRSKPSVKVHKLGKSGSPCVFCFCLAFVHTSFYSGALGESFHRSFRHRSWWTFRFFLSIPWKIARKVPTDIRVMNKIIWFHVCWACCVCCTCLGLLCFFWCCVCVFYVWLSARFDAWYVAACRRVWSYSRACFSSCLLLVFFQPVCNLHQSIVVR